MDFTTALLELLILIGIGLATPGPNPIDAFTHSGVFGKKSNHDFTSSIVATGFKHTENTVEFTKVFFEHDTFLFI